MTEAQMLLLILREGLPTAVAIADLFKSPEAPVSPAQLARLKELGGRTATDYERERQA